MDSKIFDRWADVTPILVNEYQSSLSQGRHSIWYTTTSSGGAKEIMEFVYFAEFFSWKSEVRLRTGLIPQSRSIIRRPRWCTHLLLLCRNADVVSLRLHWEWNVRTNTVLVVVQYNPCRLSCTQVLYYLPKLHKIMMITAKIDDLPHLDHLRNCQTEFKVIERISSPTECMPWQALRPYLNALVNLRPT